MVAIATLDANKKHIKHGMHGEVHMYHGSICMSAARVMQLSHLQPCIDLQNAHAHKMHMLMFGSQRHHWRSNLSDGCVAMDDGDCGKAPNAHE